MKNNKIRSKVVKESLLDYNNLANTLKENTTAAVKDLLSEAVRDTYSKILAEEDEDKDYDVEEVDDTDSENDLDSDVEAKEDEADAKDSDDVETEETDDTDADDDSNVEVDIDNDSDEDGDTEEVSIDGESEDGDEWSEFDKYKVSDDEYDFSNAEDDEIVKVYKLLNNDDQVIVNKDADNKVNIKDNETGAEYLVDLNNDGVSEEDDEFMDDDMNESRIFEIALNEFDSNVGYTDNYQNKDVLDTKGLSVADDKDKNDWGSKGLKTRDGGKRWSGKKNNASENQPFIEEDDDSMLDDSTVEEGASMGGRRGAIGSGRSTGTKQHTPDVSGNKNPYGQHHVSVAGKYKENGETSEANAETLKAESVMRKANKIFAENKELKAALGKFKRVLEEAAVTNVNLGQIIKLISENTTSQDEKKEIIARFGKEAKTVEQSKNLYESISKDLQKKNKMNIDEGKQYGVEGSKQINETQIYQSKDLLNSLDLMHRLCK